MLTYLVVLVFVFLMERITDRVVELFDHSRREGLIHFFDFSYRFTDKNGQKFGFSSDLVSNLLNERVRTLDPSRTLKGIDSLVQLSTEEENILDLYRRCIDEAVEQADQARRFLFLGFTLWGHKIDHIITYPLIEYARAKSPWVVTWVGGSLFRRPDEGAVNRVFQKGMVDVIGLGGGDEAVDYMVSLAQGKETTFRDEVGRFRASNPPENVIFPSQDSVVAKDLHVGREIPVVATFSTGIDPDSWNLHFSVSPKCGRGCDFCTTDPLRPKAVPLEFVIAEVRAKVAYYQERFGGKKVPRLANTGPNPTKKKAYWERLMQVLEADGIAGNYESVTLFGDIENLALPEKELYLDWLLGLPRPRLTWGRDVVNKKKDNDMVGKKGEGKRILSQEDLDLMGQGMEWYLKAYYERGGAGENRISYILSPNSPASVHEAKLKEMARFKAISSKVEADAAYLVPLLGTDLARAHKGYFVPVDIMLEWREEKIFDVSVSEWGHGYEESYLLDLYQYCYAFGYCNSQVIAKIFEVINEENEAFELSKKPVLNRILVRLRTCVEKGSRCFLEAVDFEVLRHYFELKIENPENLKGLMNIIIDNKAYFELMAQREAYLKRYNPQYEGDDELDRMVANKVRFYSKLMTQMNGVRNVNDLKRVYDRLFPSS